MKTLDAYKFIINQNEKVKKDVTAILKNKVAMFSKWRKMWFSGKINKLKIS